MKQAPILFPLILLAIFMFIASLLLGKAAIPIAEIFENSESAELFRKIILEVRFARAFMAFLAGGSLALCGAVLQAYLRNPLADAAVLGVSPFASLGAVIAIYFGLSQFGYWIIPSLSIIFALLGIFFLLLLGEKSGGGTGLILSGVVLSSFSGGLMVLALNLAPNPYAIAEIIDWQSGSFSDLSFKEIALVLPLVLIGILMFRFNSKFLDAMILGSHSAQSLGFDIRKGRNIIILATGIISGAITSVCGIIGFVGLIIPHIVAKFGARVPSQTFALNFLAGGVLTLFADNLTKILVLQNEIKIGVIMTLLGAPFFLFLLIKKGNKNG